MREVKSFLFVLIFFVVFPVSVVAGNYTIEYQSLDDGSTWVVDNSRSANAKGPTPSGVVGILKITVSTTKCPPEKYRLGDGRCQYEEANDVVFPTANEAHAEGGSWPPIKECFPTSDNMTLEFWVIRSQ